MLLVRLQALAVLVGSNLWQVFPSSSLIIMNMPLGSWMLLFFLLMLFCCFHPSWFAIVCLQSDHRSGTAATNTDTQHWSGVLYCHCGPCTWHCYSLHQVGCMFWAELHILPSFTQLQWNLMWRSCGRYLKKRWQYKHWSAAPAFVEGTEKRDHGNSLRLKDASLLWGG